MATTEQPHIDRAIHEPVELVAYETSWPTLFDEECRRLTALFPDLLRGVEHIGSTAIPGMPAKPIIDVLAGVDSMAVADDLYASVLREGYTTSRAFNEMLPDRRWFMRSESGRRTHHLHIVVFSGPTWRKHVLFRDLLRANPELAASYATLKSELAVRFKYDRDAYTDAKSEFIASVIAAP